jgi:hypothetical protein
LVGTGAIDMRTETLNYLARQQSWPVSDT